MAKKGADNVRGVQNRAFALKEQLQRRFPDAAVEVDAPLRSRGIWFLDVKREGHRVRVQWAPRRGFGLFAGREATYGEGPDEVYSSAKRAYVRIVDLLLTRGSTSPPKSVWLRELRRIARVSQVELAKTLAVQQSVISKRERCNDVMLSTLRSTVEALGGSLDITVVFRGGSVRLELPRTVAARGDRTAKK